MQVIQENEISNEQEICRSLGILFLKTEQRSVIDYLKSGRSLIAQLPTGYGKTICFLWPVLAWQWKIIVVSPLIALMEEQKQSFLRLGIKTIVIHSHLTKQERRENIHRILYNDWQIIITSPEQIVSWQKKLWWPQIFASIRLWAFDEAHCFFLWQYFRPAYSHLIPLLRAIAQQKKPALFLSATINEIQMRLLEKTTQLPLEKISQTIGRENIFLQIVPLSTLKERYFYLLSALKKQNNKGAVIIYCGTRRESDALASFLDCAGWMASSYHSGLPSYMLSARIKAFFAGRVQIICATSAFGMGIDYSKISTIIHWGPPMDTESYWQEVGRAGRNNQLAQSIVLWNRSDLLRWRFFLSSKNEIIFKQKKSNLDLFIKYLQTNECRRIWLAKYFGVAEKKCNACDNCCSNEALFLPIPPEIPWWKNNFIAEKVLSRNFEKQIPQKK